MLFLTPIIAFFLGSANLFLARYQAVPWKLGQVEEYFMTYKRTTAEFKLNCDITL